MASCVRMYEVYIVKYIRGMNMRTSCLYRTKHYFLHQHICSSLYSRQVQLGSRIRNYTVRRPRLSDECQSHTWISSYEARSKT